MLMHANLMFRDLTHYKGEPDPFKGDVLNQKVRDAAKETLDAIFQATDTNYNSASSKPTLTVRATLVKHTLWLHTTKSLHSYLSLALEAPVHW